MPRPYVRADDARFGPEPAIGALQTAADGSTWRKVRTLGRQAWCDALFEAHTELRFAALSSRPVDRRYVEAMGFEVITVATGEP